MGINVAALLAGLAGASTGGMQGHTADLARRRQATDDEEQRAYKAAQMQNILSEMQSRQEAATRADEDRFAKGVRPGQAPSQQAIASTDDMLGKALDFGNIGSTHINAMDTARATEPEMMDPNRFVQMNGGAYLDKAATPEAGKARSDRALDAMREAAQGRLFEHQDTLQAEREAAAERRHQQTLAGLKEKPDAVQLVQNGNDASGKPVYIEYNKNTHSLSPVAGPFTPRDQAGLGAGVGQQRQALMMSAMTEARLASERMRKTEDKILSGELTVSPAAQAGGTLEGNLSGTHSTIGALTQAAAGYGMSKMAPELQQYYRDAQAIGRAESMVMPRGGNEAMTRANAVLGRAGTGAGDDRRITVDAARQTREALFGQSGGIAQTLAPAQLDKLERGVAAIRAGEGGSPAAVRPAGATLGGQQQKASGATPSRAQALWDAAVAKHGEAKVLADFGPRPQE